MKELNMVEEEIFLETWIMEPSNIFWHPRKQREQG